MKKCPFCAEEIQDEAIKCRYCGEFLKKTEEKVAPAVPANPHAKWFQKTSTLIIGFLVVGPLIIPLLWTNPRFSMTKKIVFTVVFIVITIVFTKLMADSIMALKKYYGVMQGSF